MRGIESLIRNFRMSYNASLESLTGVRTRASARRGRSMRGFTVIETSDTLLRANGFPYASTLLAHPVILYERGRRTHPLHASKEAIRHDPYLDGLCAAAMVNIGDKIGAYSLIQRIGEGETGDFFLGRHFTLRTRLAAIKVLRPDMESEEAVQRFGDEAKLAAAIHHPAIVDVLDFDVLPDGQAYLVMEYLRGASFKKALALDPCLRRDMKFLTAAAGEVALGLSAMHTQRIVHRAIRPENLFLALPTPQARCFQVKVLEFGVAKLHRANLESSFGVDDLRLSSPRYLAPELYCSGSRVDHRVDIYALGAVLFEALSGRSPFEGQTVAEQIARGTADEAPRLRSLVPRVPEALADLVDAMIAKSPENRPANMGSVAERCAAMLRCREAELGRYLQLTPRLLRWAEGVDWLVHEQEDGSAPAHPSTAGSSLPDPDGAPAQSEVVTVKGDGEKALTPTANAAGRDEALALLETTELSQDRAAGPRGESRANQGGDPHGDAPMSCTVESRPRSSARTSRAGLSLASLAALYVLGHVDRRPSAHFEISGQDVMPITDAWPVKPTEVALSVFSALEAQDSSIIRPSPLESAAPMGDVAAMSQPMQTPVEAGPGPASNLECGDAPLPRYPPRAPAPAAELARPGRRERRSSTDGKPELSATSEGSEALDAKRSRTERRSPRSHSSSLQPLSPSTVTVHIDTEPAGAVVHIPKEVPCRTMNGSKSSLVCEKGSDPLVVHLLKPGYQTKRVAFRPAGDWSLSFKLNRVRQVPVAKEAGWIQPLDD